jgi:hypothetical protein
MANDTGRDPRVKPVVGDVLTKGNRERTVTTVLHAPFVCRTEEDHKWRCRPNGPMKEVDSNMKQWRKWAKNATVIRKGDDK